MSYFKVDICTPSRVVQRELEADSFWIPTVNGEINVLPEHTHVVSKLDTGILSVISAGKKEHFLVSEGICKVIKNKVTVLTEISETAKEVNVDAAKKKKAQAQTTLKGSIDFSQHDVDMAHYYLALSDARIKLANLK